MHPAGRRREVPGQLHPYGRRHGRRLRLHACRAEDERPGRTLNDNRNGTKRQWARRRNEFRHCDTPIAPRQPKGTQRRLAIRCDPARTHGPDSRAAPFEPNGCSRNPKANDGPARRRPDAWSSTSTGPPTPGNTAAQSAPRWSRRWMLLLKARMATTPRCRAGSEAAVWTRGAVGRRMQSPDPGAVRCAISGSLGPGGVGGGEPRESPRGLARQAASMQVRVWPRPTRPALHSAAAHHSTESSGHG